MTSVSMKCNTRMAIFDSRDEDLVENARSKYFHTWSIVSYNCLSSSLTKQIDSLFSVVAKSYASAFFEQGAMSLKQYSDLSRLYRGVSFSIPTQDDMLSADFLYYNLLTSILPEAFLKRGQLEKLIRNNGKLECEGTIYRLIFMRHTSQEDANPCGAMIVSYKNKDYFGDTDYLYIDSFAIRKDFQSKGFSYLFLLYAQKIAQVLQIQELQLFTTSEGSRTYIPFGFTPCGFYRKIWKAYSINERLEEVKSISNKRLYFWFGDASSLKMSKHKLVESFLGKSSCA